MLNHKDTKVTKEDESIFNLVVISVPLWLNCAAASPIC